MLKNIISYILTLFYPVFKKFLPFQVYTYLSVGAVNTLFNIGLFTICYSWLSQTEGAYLAGFKIHTFAVEVATIISFLLSVITGFWLSKTFAFTNASNEKSERTKQFSKYFLVALQGQFSDYLITKALIIFMLINPTIAYVISTIIMLILNYFLQKYFTFKVKQSEKFSM